MQSTEFQLLIGKAIDSVEWVSGGTDQDEDDYLVVRAGDLTLYASAPALYTAKGA